MGQQLFNSQAAVDSICRLHQLNCSPVPQVVSTLGFGGRLGC